MADLLQSMAIALCLTLILELLFALFWGVRKRGVLLVVLMNLLTNPAVNLLHAIAVFLLGWPPIWVVPILEAAAIIAEGFCCTHMIKRPWLFAVLVNGFSYTMGVIIQALI